MTYGAELVYATGYVVAGRTEDPHLRGELYVAIDSLEPNPGGFIENGRVIRMLESLGAPDFVRGFLEQMSELNRRYLLDEDMIHTLGTLSITPEVADRFRVSVQCERQVVAFPNNLMDELDAFAHGYSSFGALLIKGFNVDGGGQITAQTLAELLGVPYTEQSETSAIVQSISPRHEEAKLQTSGSFDVDLEVHVENVGQANVPDFVVLVCERNNEQAETIVLSPLKALWTMRKNGLYKEEALLWDSKFWVRAPTSFSTNERQDNHQIITGLAALPDFHADFADVGSDDPESRAAYNLFKDICLDVSEKVILQPGDALLIRNTGPNQTSPTAVQVMHGRKQFTPDPKKPRILHRVYAKTPVS